MNNKKNLSEFGLGKFFFQFYREDELRIKNEELRITSVKSL